MDYLAIIISFIALAGAGFAFLRASSSHRILVKRIETLKEKNSSLDARLRKLEGSGGRSNRPAAESGESERRNKPRQERQEQQQESRADQRHEPRHEQRERGEGRQERGEGRQEQRNEQRQKQKERRPQQPQQQPQQQQQQQDSTQPVEHRRKRENRRRNEPMETTDYNKFGDEQPAIAASPINLEMAGGDLLAELEQAAAHYPTPAAEENYSGKKYTIIPEDGLIRQHQLQQQPDSDSYIEVDVPAEGSSLTHYRFNLSGNQAFVISQGIDRLENAFTFEKPSNRKVSQVVLQQDGVLARVNNGWKIQEKARIDFR